MLAGLCWWLDYGPLLEKKGLLKYVRKEHSNERMAFGDGLSAAPLFVLIQVPLWYKCKNGSTILVFANIRIVQNTVGLLDGKNNLAAIGMRCSLNPQNTTFSCRRKDLVHVDEGSHYFLQLNPPNAFGVRDRGMAVYLQSVDGPLQAHWVNARHYVVNS
jgi:hypothetical protein